MNNMHFNHFYKLNSNIILHFQYNINLQNTDFLNDINKSISIIHEDISQISDSCSDTCDNINNYKYICEINAIYKLISKGIFTELGKINIHFKFYLITFSFKDLEYIANTTVRCDMLLNKHRFTTSKFVCDLDKYYDNIELGLGVEINNELVSIINFNTTTDNIWNITTTISDIINNIIYENNRYNIILCNIDKPNFKKLKYKTITINYDLNKVKESNLKRFIKQLNRRSNV